MKRFKYLLLILFISFIAGCDKRVDTHLKEVHWDRDMCELCKMVVSERKYAVQVVNPDNGKSYMFDDIGCTILWFKEEQISWENKAKIYIADTNTGEFIDARKAYYDTMSRTPMDYGFGAYKESESIDKNSIIINFEELRLKVLRGETMQNPLLRQTRK